MSLLCSTMMEKITTALSPAITIEILPPTQAKLPPSAEHNQVRIVQRHEYKEVALTLAQAFKDDDVAMYFVETGDTSHWSPKEKWDLHVCILEYLVYGHILKGLVTTIGPNYDSVALWMPPGQTMDDWLTGFRSGMWRLEYGWGFSPEGHTRYFREFQPLLHQTKHDVLGNVEDEAWYLVYIGTKPESRGNGYARALIESVTKLHVMSCTCDPCSKLNLNFLVTKMNYQEKLTGFPFAQADRENRHCYLESSNGINPKIYAKLGFEIKKKIYLQRATKPVELDIMVRRPVMRTSTVA